MARTIETIKTSIETQLRTYSSFDDFLFPTDPGGSSASRFNAFIYCVAAAIYAFELLQDIFKEEVEAIVDNGAAGNAAWVRSQILAFQNGDVVTLTNFVPGYATIDTAKQIVTQCSVKPKGNSTIQIKVAKGSSPPTPLSAGELSALEDYYFGTGTTQGIGFAGVNAEFVNENPDRVFVEATIYYFGQYEDSAVKTAVIAAIEAYLGSFQGDNFNGTLYVNSLVDAIQAVAGVSRVALVAMKGRRSTVAFASATTIDINGGIYEAYAGYIISEDTAGETLADKITMTLETQ